MKRYAAVFVKTVQTLYLILEPFAVSRLLVLLLITFMLYIYQAIRETVVAAFPNHQFLGEEEVDSGIDAAIQALEAKLEKTAASEPGEGYLWIVDPIDGTTNFASGIPLNMPSIAVANRNGDVVVAVLFDPHRNELFTSIKGQGAFMNGQPIRVGAQDKIGDAVVAMESPAGQESLENALKGIAPLMPKVRTIRMLGSSAVMLPWVANGRLTSYWTPDECAWDIAAGSLIVLEAGGIVTDLAGNPYTIRTRQIVASNNEKVHDSILGVLQTCGIA